MTMRTPRALAAPLAAALLGWSAFAHADTADVKLDRTTTASIAPNGMQFSPDLSGEWKGTGDVLVKIDQERPYSVRCDFTVDADEQRFDLDGECGALFVKREVRTSLVRDDEAITGTYDAALRSGTATLAGQEQDGGIDLDVTWGGEVNGDTEARMRIERDGEGLRIRTIDLDPETGQEVTTSDLVLERG